MDDDLCATYQLNSARTSANGPKGFAASHEAQHSENTSNLSNDGLSGFESQDFYRDHEYEPILRSVPELSSASAASTCPSAETSNFSIFDINAEFGEKIEGLDPIVAYPPLGSDMEYFDFDNLLSGNQIAEGPSHELGLTTPRRHCQTLTSFSSNVLNVMANSQMLTGTQSTSSAKSSLALESSCSGPSDGFETESSWSEEEDDWKEFSDPEGYELFEFSSIDQVELLSRITWQPEIIVNLELDRMKEALVDTIMKEFWVIFNQEWSANVRRHTGASPESTSPSTSRVKTTPEEHQSRGYRKHDRDGEEEQEQDDKDGRSPKRQKIAATPKDKTETLAFACPYRKHNPRKYCHSIRKWRSCALSPLDNISRVKYHRIFQCQRCKELFKNQEDLNSHSLALKACDINSKEPAEGILVNGNIEKRLRSRKKAHPGQTEKERWQEMYGILFPMEAVPNPYFEIAQDEIIRSPESQELVNYEEYSRRELPRFFRNALHEVIANEAQPIEERLKSRLISMIQDCQDKVFSTYKDQKVTENTRPVGTTDIPLSSSMESTTSFETQPSMQSTQPSIDMSRLGNFYQLPPLQTTLQTNFEAEIAKMPPRFATDGSSLDSGYATHVPALSLDGVEQMTEASDTIRESSQSQSNGQQESQAESYLEMVSRSLAATTAPDSSCNMLDVGNMVREVLATDTGYAFNTSDDFDFEKFLTANNDSFRSWSETLSST
ncbi:hypothetical protein G7Y89_g10534 [Cudoniella acicularis]|uniref:C2H2-type domain-containing protein n=1 Tax=Cudoniella acicularis TaxID=354080 RepID=A0A8H4RCK3_9HELO|nr:hypothetical protein G7Y89_g10534 [Cudoniella acicularis]